MMTTTVTVILITPLWSTVIQQQMFNDNVIYLKAAAAPRKAYVPGVMQGISG
jgi:hypothetical protein